MNRTFFLFLTSIIGLLSALIGFIDKIFDLQLDARVIFVSSLIVLLCFIVILFSSLQLVDLVEKLHIDYEIRKIKTSLKGTWEYRVNLTQSNNNESFSGQCNIYLLDNTLVFKGWRFTRENQPRIIDLGDIMLHWNSRWADYSKSDNSVFVFYQIDTQTGVQEPGFLILNPQLESDGTIKIMLGNFYIKSSADFMFGYIIFEKKS